MSTLESINRSAARSDNTSGGVHIASRLAARHRRRMVILVVSVFVLFFLSLTSISIGAAHIPFEDVWRAIIAGVFSGLGAGGSGSELAGELAKGTYAIVWDIRLPRVFMALICGAALSTCGVGMQGVLRNPLVSPYTLGISSGAAFGASTVIVLGAGLLSLAGEYILIIGAAFFCSLTAVGLVVLISRARGMKAETLILAGIAIMYGFSAGTSILQYLATHEQLARIVFWLMGSLTSVSWSEVGISALFLLAGYPVLFAFSWHLNIIGSGEEVAKSLGTDPKRITAITIITSTLVTACVVSFTGIIGFVGLVGPHIARLILGHDHRLLFPASALTGAFLLVLSDTVARSLLGFTEIPIGIVTSLIGVPFFVSILARRRKVGRV